MKVKDIRFKITDKNGESIIVGFNDFRGCDDCCVFISCEVKNIDKFITWHATYNTEWDDDGLEKDFAECNIEVVQ